MDRAFDATVVVTALDELRAERAGARGTGQLEERSARQLSQDEKVARATHVLANDGTRDQLNDAVAEVIAKLGTGDGE
jgi:dephospho-CoA kinase